MALTISIRGIAETRGRISRSEVDRYVRDFVSRHHELQRVRKATVRFEAHVIDPYSDEDLGGQLRKNVLHIGTRARSGRILNETELIQTIAHELIHWVQRTLGHYVEPSWRQTQHPYDPELRPFELEAMRKSLDEVAHWQHARLMRMTAHETKVARECCFRDLL